MFKRKFECRLLSLLVLLASVCLSVRAASDDAEWTLDPSNFRYDMSLYFSIEPESFSDMEKYEVGAFADGECRGLAESLDLPDGALCLYMRIRSNAESEDVYFLLREKASGEVYNIYGNPDKGAFSFAADEMLGLPSQPIVFTPWFDVKISAGENGSVDFENGEYAYGSEITATAVPATGYRFESWSDGSDSAELRLTVESDIDLTASFVKRAYKLTLVLDGEIISEEEVLYGTELHIADPEVKEGYVFEGWDTEIPDTMPAEDLTIYGTSDILDGVGNVQVDADAVVDVYSADGALLLKGIRISEVKNQCGPGLYIIGGRTVRI